MHDITALEKLRRRPNDAAVIDVHGEHSWQALFAGALGVVRLLRDHGVGAGGHVAILSANRVEYFQALLGCLLAGVWLTPLNRHLSAPEVDYVLADSQALLLFTAGCDYGGTTAMPVLPLLSGQLEQLNGPTADRLEQISGLLQGEPGGTLMYTSGTTGRPKGVKRATTGNLGETWVNWCRLGRAIGLDGSGCHLVTGPLYHAAPGLYAFYDLLNGCPVVLMSSFDSGQCLAQIQRYRVTHTHLVPTMFVRLLRERVQSGQAEDLSSLQLVLHGAAPVAPDIKQQMIAWWGPVLVEYWGASESGIITLVDSADWLSHPGTVGKPLPQYELSVRDEQFIELPAGAVGELYARREGQARPFVYFGDDAKTESCYRDDWFSLGDMGWLDELGYAYIADRRSNLIISGGVNIYPAEVESVLLAHPAVADVVVVGVDDAEWGKTVHAIIQPVAASAQQDELQRELHDFAAERLAKFKLPRTWQFVPQLPRHESGKLYRNQLSVR
jgi:long-chain acyl-CoA synthetase